MNQKQNPNNYTNAIVIFNNQQYQMILDNTSPFSQIAKYFFETLSLNKKEYDIVYQNQIIKTNDSRQLGAIIQKNQLNNIFYINQKSKTMTINNARTTQNPSFQTQVEISNVTSIQDINNFISMFYNNKQSQNNSNVLYSDNGVMRISFPSYQTANDFIAYLTYNTSINPLYANMKMKIIPPNLKGNYSNGNYESCNTEGRRNNLHLSNHNTNSSFLNKNNYIYNPKLYNIRYRNLAPNLQIESRKKLENYFSSQKFVRNSSPYMSEEDQRLYEQMEDKKNWYNKRGFFISVGNYSIKPNYIKNYVNLCPSESPLNHKFRDVKKKKWITEKGFL